MSATSSSRRPAVKTCMPHPAGKATPLAVTVNDLSVLVISRRLHDEKCRDRDACWNRDWRALDCFETTVRKTPRRPGGRPGRTGNLRSRHVCIIHCLSGYERRKTRALVPVPAVQQVAPASFTENLPLCNGCRTPIRPHGATEAEFPGTAANWGNNECRVCDYLAAGKDPADRFIPVQRVSFLTSLRHDIEAGRRRRGIPAAGSMYGRIPITEFVNTL